MCVEIPSVTIEVETYVRDVFLEERQLWVRISNISSNTQRILVAIG
jgi:hypothetical protein